MKHKHIVFVAAAVLAITALCACIGCAKKMPTFTLDRDDGVIEKALGTTFMPDAYPILANGEDSGLTARVKSVTGPDGEDVSLRSGSLTLTKSGDYKLLYESAGLTEIYGAAEMQWTIVVRSSDKSGPEINGVTYGVNYDVVWVGKTVPQPEISATDNSAVDWESAKVRMRLPDASSVEVPLGTSYTPTVAGKHTWEYSLSDTQGNTSVYEYEFNVLAGPTSVVTDVIGYFGEEFGLDQAEAFGSTAELVSDFEWTDFSGMPRGAIRLTQTENQWDIMGTQYLGVGLDGTMQLELHGPYIEGVSGKYDVLYLPMYNPNDYPIQVRVWFDTVMLIPAHEMMYYTFSAKNYLPESTVKMYQGDYTIIHDVYRTTFSCGPENSTYFDFVETLGITDDLLVAYYAKSRGVDEETAQEAVAAMTDWNSHNELVMEYLNNELTEEEVLAKLKPDMLPAGTQWVVGPLMGAKFEDESTAGEKIVVNLGNLGAPSHVFTYGERSVRFSDAPEFVDPEKGIKGAIVYDAGATYSGLDSACAITLRDLNLTREDLAVMMGKDDYLSLWVKKPEDCTVDFTVGFGWGVVDVTPTTEWQEIKLYRKEIGTDAGGADGLEYIFLDSGYDDGGEWIVTHPGEIVIRLLDAKGGAVYDGIRVAVAGVKLVLSGDPEEERFGLSGIRESDYAAVWRGRVLPVPSYTTSLEASVSGVTVTHKNIYVQVGSAERVPVTGKTWTAASAGEAKWIFETVGKGGADEAEKVLSTHEYSFTIYEVPEREGGVIFDSELGARQLIPYNGSVTYTTDIRYGEQSGSLCLTSSVNVYANNETFSGITLAYPYLDSIAGWDYLEIPVYNASSAVLDIGLMWSDGVGTSVVLGPGEWGVLRLTAEVIRNGTYSLEHWGQKVYDLQDLSVRIAPPWDDPAVADAVVYFGAITAKHAPTRPTDPDTLAYLDHEYGSVVEVTPYGGILDYTTETAYGEESGSTRLTLTKTVSNYWESDEDNADEFAGIILSAPSVTDLSAYTHLTVPVWNGSELAIRAGEMWGAYVVIQPQTWGTYTVSVSDLEGGLYTLADWGGQTTSIVNLSVAVWPDGGKGATLAIGSVFCFGAVKGIAIPADSLAPLDHDIGSLTVTPYGGTLDYTTETAYGEESGSTRLTLTKTVSNYWVDGSDSADEFAGIVLSAPTSEDLGAYDYVTVPVYNGASIDIYVGQMWSDMLRVEPGVWAEYRINTSLIWSGSNHSLPNGDQTWGATGLSVAIRPAQEKGKTLAVGDTICFGAIRGERREGASSDASYTDLDWTAKGGIVSFGAGKAIFTASAEDTNHLVGYVGDAPTEDYDYVRVTVRNVGEASINFWMYEFYTTDAFWWSVDPGVSKTLRIDRALFASCKSVTDDEALTSLNGLGVRITDATTWGNTFESAASCEVSYEFVKTGACVPHDAEHWAATEGELTVDPDGVCVHYTANKTNAEHAVGTKGLSNFKTPFDYVLVTIANEGEQAFAVRPYRGADDTRFTEVAGGQTVYFRVTARELYENAESWNWGGTWRDTELQVCNGINGLTWHIVNADWTDDLTALGDIRVRISYALI